MNLLLYVGGKLMRRRISLRRMDSQSTTIWIKKVWLRCAVFAARSPARWEPCGQACG